MSEQHGQCAPIDRIRLHQLLSEQWDALDALDSALFELRTTIQILEIVSDHLDPKQRVSNAIVVLVSDWSKELQNYSNRIEQAFERTRELREAI